MFTFFIDRVLISEPSDDCPEDTLVITPSDFDGAPVVEFWHSQMELEPGLTLHAATAQEFSESIADVINRIRHVVHAQGFFPDTRTKFKNWHGTNSLEIDDDQTEHVTFFFSEDAAKALCRALQVASASLPSPTVSS